MLLYYHTRVNVREQPRGYRGDVSPAITPPRGIEGTNRIDPFSGLSERALSGLILYI